MKTRKHILIIDDEPANIFALSAVLRAHEFDVSAAPGMKEGFEKLAGNSFDAVLIDMMMPGMDGYEAIAEIKQRFNAKSTPVIAVTAQAMPGDREKCLAAGADDYISKPVDADRLFSILNNL